MFPNLQYTPLFTKTTPNSIYKLKGNKSQPNYTYSEQLLLCHVHTAWSIEPAQLKLWYHSCKTLFTSFDAKSVNEMLLVFEKHYYKFSCNFFFNLNRIIFTRISYLRLYLYTYTSYTKFIIYNFPVYQKKNDIHHKSGRMYTAHFDNLQLTGSLSPYPYLQQNITQTVS